MKEGNSMMQELVYAAEMLITQCATPAVNLLFLANSMMLFEYLNQQQIVQSADAGRRKIRFMLVAELVRGQKWMLCDIVCCEVCDYAK